MAPVYRVFIRRLGVCKFFGMIRRSSMYSRSFSSIAIELNLSLHGIFKDLFLAFVGFFTILISFVDFRHHCSLRKAYCCQFYWLELLLTQVVLKFDYLLARLLSCFVPFWSTALFVYSRVFCVFARSCCVYRRV